MEWLIENWVLVLVIGGMAAMHLFGHGHGGHKHGKSTKRHSARDEKTKATADTEAAKDVE